MIQRKFGLIILVILLLPVALAACSKKEEGLPRWSFGVEGAKSKVFSTFDYGKLDKTSLTVQREGGGAPDEMTGVLMKDVLEYLDISDYASLTVTSKEGRSVNYPPEIIEDPATLLVFEINGKTEWDESSETVQLVAGNQPEAMWLWHIKTLKVNP